MGGLPPYTKHFAAMRETHKRKRGRLVGPRKLREKHASTRYPLETLVRERLKNEKAAELPNHMPGAVPYVVTLTYDPAWQSWKKWSRNLRTRRRAEQFAEEMDQGGSARPGAGQAGGRCGAEVGEV
ncbi:hypothetical protein PG988_003430 [Apiospora saccharicola]